MIINKDTIIVDPHPLLRKRAQKVALPLSKEDQELLMNMYNYVKRSQDDEIAEKENLLPAVGIAAVQIGIDKQMTAVYFNDVDEDDNIIETHEFALVNPVITSYSKKEAALSGGEGCLSIKEVHEGYVYRPHRITVKAYDLLTDSNIEIKASGYLAIVLQHEIDHLKGILFYDHINKEEQWHKKEDAILI